ncbi:MAG TPA: alcohol dehydrogenase catalytic domain-containing protein [Candidatus Binataceae bacterium]|nr:alcohol dehydrogenase catalytic domain-containing protein [Candidatus Binataceae bacterium]
MSNQAATALQHRAQGARAWMEDGRPRQAVLVAPGRLELREFEPPAPGPGAVLIEVKCALSCGTDLKTFRRGHPMFHLPTPFGHEFSGVVVEVGEGVHNFKLGDAIMAAPTAPCGDCFYCNRAQENLCPQAIDKMVMGAYADYLLLPAHVVARNAFKKPASLTFEEAALLEPLSCVFHAQELARAEEFETALILGAGPFGLLHLLALKARGVRRVVVAGRRENRLKRAGELGADIVIDVDRAELGDEMSRLNGGQGPDLVIESTGQLSGWQDSMRWVRRGGRVVFFGGCPANTTLEVDTRRMHYDNLSLLAPFHFRPRDVRRAFEVLRDRTLNAGRIINSRRRLSELGEVFELLERGAILKCAVIP